MELDQLGEQQEQESDLEVEELLESHRDHDVWREPRELEKSLQGKLVLKVAQLDQ
jgi:hypothetical protein